MMKGPVIFYPIAEMYGTDLGGVKSAKELRKSILEDIDAGLKVELDLGEVESVKPDWIKNSLGAILKDKGEDFFVDNIRLINYLAIKRSIKKYLGDFLEYEAAE